jgi:hypothetical protein
MKRILITVFALLLSVYSNYAQEYTPMKSPDVTAFVNANYIPMDESTGRVNVTIPIYTINLDGIEIPISISYDTGGVKVNSASSSVGLNWSLNAGGVVNKEVIGTDDFSSDSQLNENSTTRRIFTKYGYLMNLFSLSNHPIIDALRDKHPDIYYVNAPGLSTHFVHKPDGTALELVNKNNVIETFAQTSKYLLLPNSIPQTDLYKIEITKNNGMIYEFGNREYNSFFAFNRSSYYPNSNSAVGPLTADLTTTPWSINYLEEDVINHIYGSEISYSQSFKNINRFSAFNLDVIRNPISKRSVKYYYEDNNIVDNNRRIERSLSQYGEIRQTNFEHDYSKQKLLQKIIFPDGVVNFYYESNRLDVRGGKILKKVEVLNNYGELLKIAVFENDYFTSTENCSQNHCYRLRLNGINFLDKNNNKLPGYSFDYNTTKLPKRFSVNQDFSGYFNGLSGVSESQYLPKSYFKANQGKKSVLPFPFSGYTLLSGGNADKTPNLNFSKAASLEKITYPTGGYALFDYELHNFKFLDTDINAGGLRVKSMSIYNSNTVLQKKIEYDYNLENGKSSGDIINLPNYKSVEHNAISISRTTQISNTKLELTRGSYVTYSRVRSTEYGNGYIINEYTNPKNYPNKIPVDYTMVGSLNAPNWFIENYNNGYYETIYEDMSIQRGKLISSKIFDNQNQLLKQITNEYAFQTYENLDVKHSFITANYNFRYNIASPPYANFDLTLTSKSNLLKRSITQDYTDNGIITNEKINLYNTNLPYLKERQTIVNNTEVRKEIVYYPFDSEVSALPNITALNNLNIIIPIKKKYFRNKELLATTITSYQDFGANKILPNKKSVSKALFDLETKVNFNKYDKRGNNIEYNKKDDITISTLWGYDYQYKIAEILNADYDEVLAALNVDDIKYLQTKTNEQLDLELNNLRNNLPNAQVYSYIYTPGVGVLSITDSRGRKESYEYDSFKRRIRIKNHDGKWLTQNNYNYKLNPSVSIVNTGSLEVVIEKSATPDYVVDPSPSMQHTILSAMTSGGRGDYSYQWREEGFSKVLSVAYKYIAEVSCDTSKTYNVTVTDLNGTSLNKTVTVNAPICGEPFYVSSILGQSAGNNQGGFFVNPAEGTDFKNFNYSCIWGNGSTPSSYYLRNDNIFNVRNNSGEIRHVNLQIIIKHLNTGYEIIRTRNVTIQPEFVVPSCFIGGTTITMYDGNLKNIENIKIGDKVLSYNLKTKQTEISVVEELENPIHEFFVKLNFEKNIENINTLDHPYHVKDKGWSSYDPQATKHKYGLDVKKMNVGDTVLFYKKGKNLQEIRLLEEKFIDQIHQTYNLSKVSENHNFFANGILVHNKYSKK